MPHVRNDDRRAVHARTLFARINLASSPVDGISADDARPREGTLHFETRLGQVQEAGLRLDMQNGVVNTISWVTLTQFSLVGLVFSAWLAYRKILPLTPATWC